MIYIIDMRVLICYSSNDSAITNEKLNQLEVRIIPYATVHFDKLDGSKECCLKRIVRRCDVVLQLISSYSEYQCNSSVLIKARKNNKPIIKIGIDELLAKDDDQLYQILFDIDKKGWPVWLVLAISLLACVGVSLLTLWLSYKYVGKQVVDGTSDGVLGARGVFGDSWGSVNAIISSFAFAGVIVTLFLQNRDLNLQRKEMARQREEFEKENNTLKYQRFENLFYNMLNLQQEIVAALKYNYKERKVSNSSDNMFGFRTQYETHTIIGREVFRFTFDDRNFIKGYRFYLNESGLSKYESTLIPTYYDHYFRHLYKIIQFVDSQGFPFDEAYKYVSLLRGTLSRYELVWIYYNALNPGYTKFKGLIEKYSLLKNIRNDLLTICKETSSYYKALGLTTKEMKSNGFSAVDFEYFLSDVPEEGKYHISAFWNKREIVKGLDYLNRWREFIDEKKKEKEA